MAHRRPVSVELIGRTVADLVDRASFEMPAGVEDLYAAMRDRENSGTARYALGVLVDNAAIARADRLPLCQDCGVTIVFFDIGQDVSLEGDYLPDAVNRGVRDAYERLYLRKSVVGDPLVRKNTETNTPCFLHTEIVPGDRVGITVYLKGGGSENMSFLKMFRPTASVEEIIDHIASCVIEAGPNPCPPLFLGVGIGGTADVALVNAKRAVLRGVGSRHADPAYADIERRILERLNATGVGPLGFGGASTAAAVYIKEAPTHIATLPVALNLNCHSLRYAEAVL
ncbi:MAG TPA: fumarate hydratase [Spirochaetota bacterium]|nr:fumarate hydratase [Spirochaetota bacterium]